MNEALWDRAFRIVLGIVLAYVAWMVWPAASTVVLAIVALIAVFTGALGWCPLYDVLGMSTNKRIVDGLDIRGQQSVARRG